MQVISVSYSRIHCTSAYPYQKSVEDSDTTKASVTSFGFSWNSVCSTGAPSVATNVESSKANDSRVVSMKNNTGGMLSWSFPEALILKTLRLSMISLALILGVVVFLFLIQHP